MIPAADSLFFSYGSNSVSQLRARVENPTLVAYPGKLKNWCRIFRSEVGVWGGGGTASIVPADGCEVYGAVVGLSHDEITRLDRFEVGYSKVRISAYIYMNNEWILRDDVNAYVADDDSYVAPPSESYLTAIHVMLKEQHPESVHNKVEVYAKIQNDIVLLFEWEYKSAHLLSLPALLVIVNSHRTEKWIMPRTMNSIIDKLAEHDITTPQQVLDRHDTVSGQLDVEALGIVGRLLH